MTRKQLRKIIMYVILLYTLVLIIGILFYYFDTTEKKMHYTIFKDLIPFTIAIPAAYLGFCFQRRASFLQTLRLLWTNLLTSVNTAIQYTCMKETDEQQHNSTLILLAQSIDEVRGVYKNINESAEGVGYYPFESLKHMHSIILKLGHGHLDHSKAAEAREQLKKEWGEVRRSFLYEFDRSEPTVFNSPFVELKKS